MFVVAGATGRTGAVVAQTLLAQRAKVRVIVRSPAGGEPWRARGAEVAVASLEDAAALGRALDGAAGLYVLLPEDPRSPDFRAPRRRIIDAVTAAVSSRRVPHVVFLSSAPAALADGNGPARDLHHAERSLRETPATLTVIRAAYFQDNVAGVLAPAEWEGIYPSFLPSADVAIPTVAARDVGRLAARCLVEPPARSEIIDLVGPMYSARQLADALGAVLHKRLLIVDIPAAAHVDAFTAAGMSPSFAEALAEMFACLASGWVTPQGDRLVAGTTRIEDILPGWVAHRRGSDR